MIFHVQSDPGQFRGCVSIVLTKDHSIHEMIYMLNVFVRARTPPFPTTAGTASATRFLTDICHFANCSATTKQIHLIIIPWRNIVKFMK
jgi:hypothetical protein